MGKTELVSIIIPVYKVEKYLEQCLESVCSQTYQNLEIIIIDDESPDRSGLIADKFAEKDDRIHVEHIKNRGAAGARNVGLDLCSGEYIMFVDSDDWLELNAVKIMMDAISKNQCDIVLCQYWDEFVNRSEHHSFMYETGVKTSQEFALGMIHSWEYIINWNKIYRKKVIEGLRFLEGRCIDDEFFTYKAVIRAQKTILVEDYLYHYRMRKSSAMGNPANQKQRLTDQVDFVTERFKPLCEAFPDLKTPLLCHKMEVLLSVMGRSSCFPDVYAKARKELKRDFWRTIIDAGIDINIKKSCIAYLFRKNQNSGKVGISMASYDNYFE